MADSFAILVAPCSQAEAEAGTNNNKPMTPARVKQQIEGLAFTQFSSDKFAATQFALPGAPTATVNATAGNLNGDYSYVVSFVNSLGETGNELVTASASPSNQQVDLTNIPLGPTGTTARKIYRGKNSGYNLNLIATISDNTTTTFTDNVTDAAAAAAQKLPRVNTTGGCLFVNDSRIFAVSDLCTIIGSNAAINNSGERNTIIGKDAGENNGFGYWLTIVGDEAGQANTVGYENSRFGFRNGQDCEDGFYNCSFGVAADQHNVSGIERTSMGYVAGKDGTASSDTNVGAYAGVALTSGGANCTFGVRAGAFLNDGVTNLTLAESSIYLGAETRSGQNDADHEIVIGNDARGAGTYTTKIGTPNHLACYLEGSTIVSGRGWDPVSMVLQLKPRGETAARGTGIGLQILAQPTGQNTPLDVGFIYGIFDGDVFDTERLTLQSVVGGTRTDTMSLKSGKVGISENNPDYKLDVNGSFGFAPGSSVTPVDNGDVVFELTNNTTLTVRAKGSDGTVRSGTITLS